MSQGFTTSSVVNNPVGSMQMFAGATAPSGYLICDGSAISRATYSKLFSVVGEAFGAGDSSTTFNIPDMQGAAPAGVGTSTGYTSNETVALGTKYDDQFQGHWHDINRSDGFADGVLYLGPGPDGGSLTEPARWPITDGVNGTPRTGSVTKGKTVGVNFIIKY